jgi:hypothetical protein
MTYCYKSFTRRKNEIKKAGKKWKKKSDLFYEQYTNA